MRIDEGLLYSGSSAGSGVSVKSKHVPHSDELSWPNDPWACPLVCGTVCDRKQTILHTSSFVGPMTVIGLCKVQCQSLRNVQLLILHQIVFHHPAVLECHYACSVRMHQWKLDISNILGPHIDQQPHRFARPSDQLGVRWVNSHVHQDQAVTRLTQKKMAKPWENGAKTKQKLQQQAKWNAVSYQI